jgi:glycosyltransferase involved in cell wall biosynthesis
VRILYHHRTRAGDAQGIHIAEMQRAFRARGHQVREVSLVPATGEATASGGATGDGLARRVEPLLRRAPRWLGELGELAYNLVALRRLDAAIRAFRPALLYERYAANTFAGLVAARRHRLPFVLEVNAPLAREKREHGGLAFPGVTRRIERWVCSRSTCTIAVTGVLRDLLVADGVPRAQIVVMPNGVHPALLAGDRARGRQWLGLAAAPDTAGPAGGEVGRSGAGAHAWRDDPVVVGFLGWVRPWHGLERLLEAAAADGGARWRDAGIVLAIGGEGPALDALRARAAAIALDVRLPGAVPRARVPDFLAALDVAVQPAVTPYACPMKLLEYMAAGCAIVAPGSPNVRELLVDGETARLCGDGAAPTAGELGEAVLELATAPGRRRELGAAARAAIHGRGLLWDENARRVEELVAERLRPARSDLMQTREVTT